MATLIKVTLYMDPDLIPMNLVDLEHDTGLTDRGFHHFHAELSAYGGDVEFEVVRDADPVNWPDDPPAAEPFSPSEETQG